MKSNGIYQKTEMYYTLYFFFLNILNFILNDKLKCSLKKKKT